MIKIGIISHYNGMSKKFKHLEKQLNCQLIFMVSGLNHAIYGAIKLEKEYKVHAIITVSATAEFIKKHVEVPVIPIYLTNYNIIQALYTAKKHGEKVVFANMTNQVKKYDFKYIKKLMKYDVDNYSFEKIEDTLEIVERAIREGKDVLVTPAEYMAREAKKRGLISILIEIQELDIVEAIERTKYIIEIKDKEQEKIKWLSSIVDSLHEGVFIVDGAGKINTINRTAEKILEIDGKSIVGFSVDTLKRKYQFFQKISDIDEIEIVKRNDKEIVVDRRDIFSEDQYIGTIVNISELKQIQKLELKTRKKINPQGFIARSNFQDIKGSSIAMLEAKKKAMRYAKTDSNVFIYGESGSGKEIFAQSIHNYSNCSEGPFLAVNCATFPEHLLESELFGYDEGAFTGAKKGGKMGLLEMAHSGTLFLDEIGEMPIQLQARLLRVLQEKMVRRIGGEKNIPVNVRIISATNKDLYEDIKENKFREDLYYRVNVLNINIPPLRERKDDIEEITMNFINSFSKKQKKEFYFHKKYIDKLWHYDWPGNIRELQNFIERLLVISEDEIIEDKVFEEVFGEMTNKNSGEKIHDSLNMDKVDNIIVPIGTMKEMEEYIIKKVYNQQSGNKKRVERLLDISSTTLWRRFKEFKNPLDSVK